MTGQVHWSRQRLGEGSAVIVDGRPATIAAVELEYAPQVFTLASGGGGLRLSANDLLFDKRIKVPGVDDTAGEGSGSSPGTQSDHRRLLPSMRTLATLVGEEQVERALTLAAHIDEVETGFKNRFLPIGTPDPRYDRALVKSCAARELAKIDELRGTSLEMGLEMLRKYRRKYKRAGYQATALIPGYQTRNRTKSNVRLLMIHLMREDVLGRVGKAKVTRQVVLASAWRTLKQMEGFSDATKPCKTTFYDWIADDPLLTSYFANTATTNRSNDLKPEGSYGFFAAKVTRPGEGVMIDTWEVPVRSLGADGKPMNVRLVLAIDIFTRSLLAWRFVPMAEKAIDISLLLAHMLTPEPMRPDWEEMAKFQFMNLPFEALCSIDVRLRLASLKPVILPEIVYIDNGKPYDSLNFRLSCQRLGISIQPSRVIHPTDKAIVEASFKAIQSLWAMVLPGFKGDSVKNRGLNPDEEAVFWPEHLHEMFTQWACTAWQQRAHAGLAGVPEFPCDEIAPQQMYEHGILTSGFTYYPISPLTYLELLPIRLCSISDKGITIDGRRYRGPILAELGQEASPFPEFGGKWPIALDPHNITRAYVKHPGEGDWHIVKWQYADVYGTPMSDYRYRTAKVVAAKRVGKRPLSNFDVVQVAMEIRDRELARIDMTPGELSKDAALDGERVRMAVPVLERADGTVGIDGVEPVEGGATETDLWDVAAAVYTDDDPYVEVQI